MAPQMTDNKRALVGASQDAGSLGTALLRSGLCARICRRLSRTPSASLSSPNALSGWVNLVKDQITKNFGPEIASHFHVSPAATGGRQFDRQRGGKYDGLARARVFLPGLTTEMAALTRGTYYLRAQANWLRDAQVRGPLLQGRGRVFPSATSQRSHEDAVQGLAPEPVHHDSDHE